ncbi:MAG: hypothetical protein U5L07_07845 [Desulfobacterales bacterium]|nr:hypothetical protein [Desulfobacterales bacterium]
MKLTCPACGAVASAEAWQADANARQALKIISELPGGVARNFLGYLALFRPAGGRGLSWKKALRLAGELAVLVGESHIAHDKKPARKNHAEAWARAMERVIETPPRRLPLKSHGYLKAVAYEIADEMDKQAEVKRNRAENTGRYRPKRDEAEPAPINESVEEMLARIRGRAGSS